MTLRMRLFGPLQAIWQDQPLPPPTRPRLQSLWAYLLLLHRYRPASRDHLAFTFWPDTLEAQARASLRQYLHKLRRWLPPSTDGPWLLTDATEIRLNPQAPLWVDVWAFEDGLTQTEGELEAAARLVAADLLPNLYDDWLLVERERLRLTYIRALTRLVMLCQARRDWPSALTWAHRLVAYDPLNEEAQRLLIGVYYAGGNRPAALQQFEDYERLLEEELGVGPMPDTVALRDAISRGEPLPGLWPTLHTPPQVVVTPLIRVERPGLIEERPLPAAHARAVMPFVGREAELQRLVETWRQAIQGSGDIVLVGGEAGVGKTRLLKELATHVQHSGGQVLWGHCYTFERQVPYQPAVEVLRAALPRLVSNDIPPLWLAEAARLIPELRERRPDIPEPVRLEPEQEQARLMEGLCRCLLGLADQQVLLVLLEDLHWAAESTLAWLHALSRQVQGAPVLIIATYRQEEVGRGHPLREFMRELRREGWGTLLTLQPLAGNATQDLVQVMSGLGEAATRLARQLQMESEGNPFFLAELVHHLQETGQLHLREGRWAGAWVEAGSQGRVSLPESVREVIQERLERLSDGARDLMRCAAVAGREFDIEVVRAALGWGEEKTLRALEEVLERGLVREGALATTRDHTFNHHLVQEVTYAVLHRTRRRVWHGRVGAAMVAAYGDAAAGELAYHFEHAGARAQALKYLKLAGDQAAGRYAHVEAVDYYGRALALVPEEGLVTRYDLLAARIGVWDVLGRREEQQADLEALEAAAKALGDDLRLARTYSLWAVFYDATMAYDAHAQAARSALALFRQAGDRRGEAESLCHMGREAYNQDDMRASCDYYRAALALYQELGDQPGQAWTLHELGATLIFTGAYTEARASLEQSLALCRAIGDRVNEASGLTYLGWIDRELGDYAAARAYSEQGLALVRAVGHRWVEADALHMAAWISYLIGDFDAADDYYRQAVFIYQAIGNKGAAAHVLIHLGRLSWHLGDTASAWQTWQEVLTLAHILDFHYHQIRVQVDLGNYMREAAEYEAAHTYLNQALDLVRQVGPFPWLEAHVVHHLGELAWAEGDTTTAIARWREAVALHDALGLAVPAQASRARLAEALTVVGQPAEAGAMAEAVWAAWRATPPQGEEFDEVRQGYLALARTFVRLGAPEPARACLGQAHAFIQERAGRIADETRRHSFLSVAVNREIESAASALVGLVSLR